MLKNGLTDIVLPRVCMLILAMLILVALVLYPKVDQQLVIKQVLINKSLYYVDKREVDLLLQQALEKNFFTINLKGVAQSLSTLPWVDSVQVRKVWPNKVMVSITERKPIARWEDSALISAKGELFTPKNLSGFDHLPRLEGSIEQRDKITVFYYEASQLLQDQNVSLASLKMNTAFDWQIELNNGLLLVMSSQQGIEKLKQFKAIYAKHIVPQLDKISRVDLRYDTGFVVAWRDDKNSMTGGSLALR